MDVSAENVVKCSTLLGAAFSIGMGAIGAGIGLGIGGGEAARASARQPSGHNTIFKTMLLGQAMTETAAIFALLVSFMLLFALSSSAELSSAAARLGAGFAIGFGALGSGIGAGLANAMACRGLGRRPEISRDVNMMMLLGQSFAQSTVVFALIIALLLLFRPAASSDMPTICRFLGAGLCMGLGAVGPGFGSGLAGAYGVFGVSCNARQKQTIMRTMLIGQSVSQSTAIYALVIAILLIFGV